MTDLHYCGRSTNWAGSDVVQRKLISKNSPDFIVYTGDIVNDYETGCKTLAWHTRAVTPAISKNISWAITLGNHDMIGSQVDYSKIKNSRTSKVLDYYININNDLQLIFMYSGNLDGFTVSQITWMKSIGLNKRIKFIFTHVPPTNDQQFIMALPKNTRGVFFGHLHGKNDCVTLRGVPFCYGSHAGMGVGGGSLPAGGRMITLNGSFIVSC